MSKKNPFYIFIACIEIIAIICVVFFITKGVVENFVQEPSTLVNEKTNSIHLKNDSLKDNSSEVVEKSKSQDQGNIEPTNP